MYKEQSFIIIIVYHLFYRRGSSSKTVKQKRIQEGSHGHDLMKHASQTLGSGNIKLAVQLPDGEDLNEWIAVNSKYCIVCVSMVVALNALLSVLSAVDFFNQINMLYGTITEQCTSESCPVMSAGPK